MTEQEAVVCMDVGGTEIKAAPVGAGGRLLAPVQHFPARSTTKTASAGCGTSTNTTPCTA